MTSLAMLQETPIPDRNIPYWYNWHSDYIVPFDWGNISTTLWVGIPQPTNGNQTLTGQSHYHPIGLCPEQTQEYVWVVMVISDNV